MPLQLGTSKRSIFASSQVSFLRFSSGMGKGTDSSRGFRSCSEPKPAGAAGLAAGEPGPADTARGWLCPTKPLAVPAEQPPARAGAGLSRRRGPVPPPAASPRLPAVQKRSCCFIFLPFFFCFRVLRTLLGNLREGSPGVSPSAGLGPSSRPDPPATAGAPCRGVTGGDMTPAGGDEHPDGPDTAGDARLPSALAPGRGN